MTLLEKAQTQPVRGTHNYDLLVEPVAVLRRKGWRYREIHQWLREQGEHIHDNPVTFASVLCRRLKHRTKTQ